MIDQVFGVVGRRLAEQHPAGVHVVFAGLDVHEHQRLGRAAQRDAQMVDGRPARGLVELFVALVLRGGLGQARQQPARVEDADRLVLQPLGLLRRQHDAAQLGRHPGGGLVPRRQDHHVVRVVEPLQQPHRLGPIRHVDVDELGVHVLSAALAPLPGRAHLLVDAGVVLGSPFHDLGDAGGATQVLLQMELLRAVDPARQEVAQRPPFEPGRAHRLSGVAGHQQPGRATARPGDGVAQLDHHRRLEQGQVLDLVDHDAVETVVARRHFAVAQPFDGPRGRDQLGEDRPDPLAVPRQALGHLQQRLGRPVSDALVDPQVAVGVVLQTGDARAVRAAAVAGDRPAEEDAAQLGVQRVLPPRPRAGHVAPQPREDPVELRAAGGQRLPGHVGAADLAHEGREVAGDHLHVGRGERREALFGVAREGARPREIEHPLGAPGLYRLPEHRRLAGPRAAQDQPDRALVLDELHLIVRPGRAGDVLVLVQVVGRRQGQEGVGAARLQRGVVVVVPDVPHQDGALGHVEGGGRPAAARRPPQVVLHAVVAAQRRPAPALVAVSAALDDGGPAVRGEVLQHDAQPLVEVRPPAQPVGNFGMQPDLVPQAAGPRLAGGRTIGAETQPGSRTRPGFGEVVGAGQPRQRRARPFPEHVGDLPALPGGQRERRVAHVVAPQAEPQPRRLRDVAHVDVQAARQLPEGLPAVPQFLRRGRPVLHQLTMALYTATSNRSVSRDCPLG